MKGLARQLYFWTLVGIVVGIALGAAAPDLGASLKPLADAFIAMIRLMVAPLVFCTIALGLSGAGEIRKAGRVGLRAIAYFEILSTAALASGLLVANALKPGAGFGPLAPAAGEAAEFAKKAADASFANELRSVIPKSFIDAFGAEGNLLQVLLLAALVGWALGRVGEERARPVRRALESANALLFAMIGAIMKLAPIGAGAAMAFTIGRYGLRSIGPLAYLMACLYGACVLFVSLALGLVARACGFSVWRFIRCIRREMLLVLGTSSSESALAPMIEKLERLGCSRSTVGLVVPAGYSFNLDGTNIYLSMGVLFVAQATGVELSLVDQLAILGVAMLTSKGASGVTGAGFVTLAATLAASPKLPVAGLSLLVGVDRFMSEARALTNVIGNGVAALAIARWEGELSADDLKRALDREIAAEREA